MSNAARTIVVEVQFGRIGCNLCTIPANAKCTVTMVTMHSAWWCYQCNSAHWAPSLRNVRCTSNSVYRSTGQSVGVVNGPLKIKSLKTLHGRTRTRTHTHTHTHTVLPSARICPYLHGNLKLFPQYGIARIIPTKTENDHLSSRYTCDAGFARTCSQFGASHAYVRAYTTCGSRVS